MFSFPRIPDLIFASVLIWLFVAGEGWSVLLADGDTGWHIRNGEQILESHRVPYRDSFSFDTGTRPWFAWEWLSDVLFAVLYRAAGLRGVCLFCGATLAACVAVLFRHIVNRAAGFCIALPLTLLAAGASSIHYLARPHVIGLLFFALAAQAIDAARSISFRNRLWWMLPLLFMVWANCHGSFLAGLALLLLLIIEKALLYRSDRSVSVREALLHAVEIGVLCALATLCNPYGWHLHSHALDYLRSAWIQAGVEEFQSPRFRSESMLQYEFLLLCGAAALPWCWRRKQIYPGLSILLWAHESLTSVRHVPVYCLAVSPFLGSWAQSVWDERCKKSQSTSILSAFESVNLLWRPWARGFTVWPAILCAVLAVEPIVRPGHAPVHFPESKFPVMLVQNNLGRLARKRAVPLRIFSSDQWSDYLIFRAFPAVRVFFDGRSDFFADWRGQQYLDLMSGAPDCARILDREAIDFALVPSTWSLAGVLRHDSGWRTVDADRQAILFERIVPKDISLRAVQQRIAAGL